MPWHSPFTGARYGFAFLISLSTGCAGHSAKTLEARAALDANQPAQARQLLNEALKVKTANDFPAKAKDDDTLFILDRSMISQQLEDYKASSNDLQYADKAVEMLDLSRTAMSDVGKYIFSDDSGPYKGTPYEKAMINTMNMVNYLARHDLNGARIEARRLSIIQKYLRENKSPASGVNAPGGYVAGFVFERSGKPNIALRYYDEALEFTEFKTLLEPISRLSHLGSFSSPRIQAFLKKHTAKAPASTAATEESVDGDTAPALNSGNQQKATKTESDNQVSELSPPESELGDLLVVINYGRVPAKVAKRIPIGLALTYASLYMSAANRSSANRLAAQGLVTWINYPDMEEVHRKILVPTLHVDERAIALEGAVAVDILARQAYEKDRGKIVASAITRLVARIIAGEAAGAAAKAASNDSLVGAIVSIGTQAALTAADTPDTRSWSTLPARMAVSRVRLAPGKHHIEVRAQGLKKTVDFTMAPGGWEAIVLTVLK